MFYQVDNIRPSITVQPINPVRISNSVPLGTQFGTLNCGRNGTELHRLLQIIHPHGTKVLERWFGGCVRYDMVRGHHASSSSRGSLWISGAFRGTPVQYTGGPIFLLGCLSLPPAVGGSHGMGRWSAASAWLVAAILFQTCFRPLQTGIHAWCWSIRRGCWRYDGGWYLVWDMTVYMALFFSSFFFSSSSSCNCTLALPGRKV